MGASVSQPPSSMVANTEKPAAMTGVPAPPPLTDSKVQPAQPSAESERILVEPEETGPGSFEDLHRKCKGNFVLLFNN